MKFVFSNPVRIRFGADQLQDLGEELALELKSLSQSLPSRAPKILLTYGGGSIKKNGVYDSVLKTLRELKKNNSADWIEFSGIEPNPTYETLMQAVQMARSEAVDFILAVGGGSVVDGSKFIAAAVPYPTNRDPWEILNDGPAPEKALPLGCVLTLPATGSEMNCFAVVTRKSEQSKLAFGSPLVYPRFSLLDPKVTLSLPQIQISNGIADAFAHILEQYLTYPTSARVQEGYAETLLKILLELGPKALAEPQNLEVRTQLMWVATQALNGNLGSGVPQDWATHGLGHALTSRFGLDHGQTLTLVFPALLKILFDAKKEKLAQMGRAVFSLEGSTSEIAKKTIVEIESFFTRIQAPIRLRERKISVEKYPNLLTDLVEDVRRQSGFPLGDRGLVDAQICGKIFETAL